MKHKGLLLILPVALLCLQACKKDAATPQSKITVVGKWQMARHDLKFVKDGVQTDELVESNYNKDDFEEYFADGTGYQSEHGTLQSASLNSFTYTLKNNILTLFLMAATGLTKL